MTYLLKSFLAVHYRASENRWQTVTELVEATGRTESSVRNGLKNLDSAKRLQKQGVAGHKRYRIDPTVIERKCMYEPTFNPTPNDHSRRLERVRQSFCKKWGVEEPYQATLKNPEAMRE